MNDYHVNSILEIVQQHTQGTKRQKLENMHDKYKSDYIRFMQNKNPPTYLAILDEVFYVSDIACVLRYKATDANKKRPFLLVPSIFNSPEILFLAKEDSFIENLRKFGDVYLIEWQENNQSIFIHDLISEIEFIINKLQNYHLSQIHLIGHCIGGNICLAAAHNDNKNNLSSLTLLTTPWDFSHLSRFASIGDNLFINSILQEHQIIPKIYVQIMFFLMFPMQFQQKLNKYFTLPESDKEIFLAIESWLQSGISLPKTLYSEIITNFCLQNISFNKKWIVSGGIVNLANISTPTCIIYAKDDKIVPYLSVLPLQKELKNSTIIEAQGGHINYLITSQESVKQQYNSWLSRIDI